MIKYLENKTLVDHLSRSDKNSDTNWKYPSREDIHLVESEQVVKCTIKGQWDMAADSRKRLFTLENVKTISYAVKQHVT